MNILWQNQVRLQDPSTLSVKNSEAVAHKTAGLVDLQRKYKDIRLNILQLSSIYILYAAIFVKIVVWSVSKVAR